MIELFSLSTFSPEETQTFGSAFGSLAWSGLILGLHGPMGAGKTAFTQGFARGLGVEETVTSPTYAIIQEYCEGRVPLYHMDWFRLSDPDEVQETGAEEYFGNEGICIVEWPERGNLPSKSLHLDISIKNRGNSRVLRLFGDPAIYSQTLLPLFQEFLSE